MSRITYKMVKQWLKDSEFANTHGITINSWNDYYYILNATNNIICSGRTPSEVWEEFNLYKQGYYLAINEMQK